MTRAIWVFYLVMAVAVVAFTAMNKSHATELASGQVLKPANGMSFDIGAKRAVTYFRPDAGACNVTVLVAPQMNDDGALPEAGSRMTMLVLPGKPARVDAADGKSVELGCGFGAREMTVRAVDRAVWGRTAS